ncbi:MAG: hypothetical protein IPO43_04510 [Rhodoferax sp.]|nr:hypothetical protein [Rhodoferax sp.]
MGSASHLSAERFRLNAGIAAVHIPFKGGAEMMTEVIAGRIDFAFLALGAALPLIRDGKLAALAVNSAARSSVLPEVPTLRQAGFSEADYPMWFGDLPARQGTARHRRQASSRDAHGAARAQSEGQAGGNGRRSDDRNLG